VNTSSVLTLVIRNAQIIDGTGSPPRFGDIAIAGDRIVAVGQVEGRAPKEIDAAGHVAAPGFIDIHTHYDPQLCWDRLATPSPEHGVTTVIMGNCSVTLAPVRPAHRDRIVKLFGSVEDMESSLLQQSVPFSWETFAEYLAFLRPELGPNVGALLGHAPLRMYVMGDAAAQRPATAGEIQTMCEILRDALRAGAFGLSFTFAHLDEKGLALPCSYADRNEKLALIRALADEGRGIVEVAPNLLAGDEAVVALIDEFGEYALQTGVLCSISPILQSPLLGELWRTMLDRFENWQQRGAPLYAQTQVRPLDMTVQISKGSVVLSKGPQWRQLLELPVAQRIERLRDPEVRRSLRVETANNRVASLLEVKLTHAARNEQYVGRKLCDIAADEGKSLLDVLADIALADDLETEFSLTGVVHADTSIVAGLLEHPGIHIGSADAGAHINQFCGAGDTCYLFEKFVRQEGRMTLQRAVQRLTSDLARAWHITDRGELAPGRFADVVIFDSHTISRGDEVWVDDVPGGGGRYVRHPTGIDHVIVNGELFVDRGRYTAARPGRLI
jgi:N-acyl-D-amino-acid deacylase